MNKVDSDLFIGTSKFAVGSSELDIWPDRCQLREQNCMQCYLAGKIQCHPRFFIPYVPKNLGMIKVMSLQGKSPPEIAKATGFTINEVYDERRKLRHRGVQIVRMTHREEQDNGK